MQSVIIYAVLIFTSTYVCAIGGECNPDGNGQPVCTSNNLSRPFRNFWDPTAYWWCVTPGVEAQLRRCPSSNLFYCVTKSCVPSGIWNWTPPCSDSICVD